MTKSEYLLSIKTSNPAKIRDTWVALGSLTCYNSTKLYLKDAIYQIKNDTSEYNNALIYCNYEYRVEDTNSAIEWETMQTSTAIEGLVSFTDGIQAPHFTLLLTSDELTNITEEIDTSFIPFNDYTAAQAEIIIPENELLIIMSE